MLTEDDRQACAEIMDGYLSGSVADPVAAGIEAGQIFNKLLIFLDIHVINSLLFLYVTCKVIYLLNLIHYSRI